MPLALYFNDDESNRPRSLVESDGPFWLIGRPSSKQARQPDISFNCGEISKEHAFIRVVDEGGFSSWQIKHRGKNRTVRVRRGAKDELPFDMWLPIEDGDRYYFVREECGFVVTTDLEETLNNVPFPQHENSDSSDEGDRTINVTLEQAIAEAKATQHGRTFADAATEIARILLDGPEGVHKVVWRIFLTVAVLLGIHLWTR